jgi:hypothetical protein
VRVAVIADRLYAILVSHYDVRDHQGWPVLLAHGVSLSPVPCLAHIETCAGQRFRDEVTVGRVILDNQNFWDRFNQIGWWREARVSVCG